MGNKTVRVTTEEMQQLKLLAEIVKNQHLPLSERRIAKSQYDSIIKHAKSTFRGTISTVM